MTHIYTTSSKWPVETITESRSISFSDALGRVNASSPRKDYVYLQAAAPGLIAGIFHRSLNNFSRVLPVNVVYLQLNYPSWTWSRSRSFTLCLAAVLFYAHCLTLDADVILE